MSVLIEEFYPVAQPFAYYIVALALTIIIKILSKPINLLQLIAGNNCYDLTQLKRFFFWFGVDFGKSLAAVFIA